jgi:uncharacterized RmlC-like cupin family protein
MQQNCASETAPSMPGVCQLIRPAETNAGQQGLNSFEGVARETVGSRALFMHLVTSPPGGRSVLHPRWRAAFAGQRK